VKNRYPFRTLKSIVDGFFVDSIFNLSAPDTCRKTFQTARQMVKILRSERFFRSAPYPQRSEPKSRYFPQPRYLRSHAQEFGVCSLYVAVWFNKINAGTRQAPYEFINLIYEFLYFIPSKMTLNSLVSWIQMTSTPAKVEAALHGIGPKRL
jgi:hypothetical protein